MKKTLTIAFLAATTGAAVASPVLVEIHGDVWGNQISAGELGMVSSGESATLSFQLDSTTYMDSASFPTRGYEIDLSTLNLSFSGGASIGAAPTSPTPAYFVVRDNDPAADGFFVSYGTDLPSAIELDQAGVFGNFGVRFNVSYLGDTLGSLDLLDAVGSYDFTGLTVFGMGVNDGPIEDVLGMDFSSMTITAVPAPAGAMLLGFAGVGAMRRRR